MLATVRAVIAAAPLYVPRMPRIRQADVGDDDQLRLARLGHRRGARLSLSGDASRRPARRGRRSRRSSCRRGASSAAIRIRREACLINFYARDRAPGPASGQGRAGFRRAGRLAFARRHRTVSRRRAEAQRPDALGAARVRRCRRARRRRPARVPRRRPHPARHLDAAAGGRADQSDAATSDAAGLGLIAFANDLRIDSVGVIQPIELPALSLTIAMRPTPGTSHGSRTTSPPSLVARASAVERSFTAT